MLYCLNKKNGTILWWNVIPSRSIYNVEIAGEKLVVSSFSSLLVSFKAESGAKAGNYNARQEIKSNPLWLDPLLEPGKETQ